MTAEPGAVTFANPDVLAFYRQLPFNYRQSVHEHAVHIRRANVISSYSVLTPLLGKKTSLLDVGCGAGWFSLNAAYHRRCQTIGIDFNEVAINRARDVAQELGVSAAFEVADLFLFNNPVRYDLVVSLGVLHHTNDCNAALDRLCRNYVKPGGHVFVGLYHKYGRRPFLEHFDRMRQAGASEADMLMRYRQLHAALTDDTHALSWFRDQVLHPHETQHTLREIVPLLAAAGMSLISTSVNGFAPFDDLEQLYDAEPNLERVANQRLTDGQYFPGFFVFLARKG
jgi:2-polyprenyl-3-methyl-5-hydroxy-6-metoxy-1,4-benzoquinol methylase